MLNKIYKENKKDLEGITIDQFQEWVNTCTEAFNSLADDEMHILKWGKEGKELFGTSKTNWHFQCPSCGGVQSVEDFIKEGYSLADSYILASQECLSSHTNTHACGYSAENDPNAPSIITDINRVKVLPFYTKEVE